MNSVDHPNIRSTLIANLLKGREMTAKLQNLIDEPDRHAVDLQDVALQILRSFTDSLSLMTALADSAPTPTSAAEETTPKPPVKNRRGCYKRRRSSDSRVVLSALAEDGHAWRKYGQKEIMNSTFPRCYYRCTHKPQGCKALKQVQKIKASPSPIYQITYLGRHTCTTHPHSLLPEERSTTRLISFQSGTTPDNDQTILTIDYSGPPSPVIKEEEAESCTDAKPVLLEETWQEFMERGCYSPVNWDEGTSCGSTSFEGLGMEINGEFPDIETFQFDDHI